jgi:hypothetical protein
MPKIIFIFKCIKLLINTLMGVKSEHIGGKFNTLKKVILRKNLTFVKLSFTLCCENGKCGLYLYHNQKQITVNKNWFYKRMIEKFNTT